MTITSAPPTTLGLRSSRCSDPPVAPAQPTPHAVEPSVARGMALDVARRRRGPLGRPAVVSVGRALPRGVEPQARDVRVDVAGVRPQGDPAPGAAGSVGLHLTRVLGL